MSVEIKAYFDEKITEILAHLALPAKTKPLKKSLKIMSYQNPTNKAEICFDYLSGQKAYYLALTGWSNDFSDFIKNINPPYRSNMPDDFDHHFFMTTLQEQRGLFNPSQGKVFLPNTLNQADELLNHINDSLNKDYKNRAINFINFSSDLVLDIFKNPNFYSYPTPLIAFTLAKNNLKLTNFKLELGKRHLKNKVFDSKLLADFEVN